MKRMEPFRGRGFFYYSNHRRRDADDPQNQTMAWRPENFCRVRPYPNSSKPTAFNIEGDDTLNQTFQKIVGGVLAEALPSLKPETVIISIAAGVTLHDLRDAVQGRCHVVRVMPNTPALVGAGVFGIQEEPALPKDVFAMILDLFGLLGSTIVLPEKKFNAFMALVGCGPAYVFHFMDALAEAGVTMGFTRQEALELVTQLVLGSAKLAALPGSHPAILREQVCSPAGVTIAAVNHLDRTAVRGHLIDAVLAAYAKS